MPVIRTGMESAIAFRLGPPFIINARQDCTVVSVSPVMITVKYTDNKIQSYKLGFLGGKSGGLTVAQKMVTNLKAGQKLNESMTIAYNESFFMPDWANPGYSILKTTKVATVALPETQDTIEDSTALSTDLCKDMASDTIVERAIVVNFDQAVSQSVKIADSMQYDTVLCYVTEQSAVGDGPIDSEALEQLKRLGAHAPRAKSDGIIHSIVVYYNGDLSDMSPSLRKLCKSSDDRLADEAKSTSSLIHTGQVSSEYRVKAEPLQQNQAVIMYNIIQRRTAGNGDKFVLGNQLKTVAGSIYQSGSISAEGKNIDVVFGLVGISNRICMSPAINGSTATLVRLMTDKAIQAYDGK